MLAFIDESGHPNAKDQSSRPVVAAVCFDESNARAINSHIHAMKRDVLGKERAELKGRGLINRPTYRRLPEARAFAEDFFATLRNLPITVFASIMESPFEQQQQENDRLENRFRFLIQRIEMLAAENETMVNVFFDGHGSQLSGLSERFSHYPFRSSEGTSSRHIADSPAFVDSASSVGIQIADMCAYVIRVYQENRLFRDNPPHGDEYLTAIPRWYRIVEERTKGLITPEGEPRPGFYYLTQGQY